MRRIHTVLGSGCLFLLASGWVCSDRVSGETLATDANQAALNAAVSAAAGTELAQAVPIPPTVATQPAATAPANLNKPELSVGVDGMVEQINAEGLDVTTALQFLSRQSHRNIIASKEVKGPVTVNLYHVTINEALDAILHPNGFDYIEKGNFIYVYTKEEIKKIKDQDRKTINKVFRLHYITANDASVLIKPLLSTTGQVALTPTAGIGLPTGATDTGGSTYAVDDTLVINDYPEQITDIEKALKQLDVRPKQVLVEATILRATLNENNAMGVDLVSLSGVDFPTLVGLAGSSSSSSGSGSSSSGSSGSSGTTSSTIQNASQTFAADGRTQLNTGTNFASQVPAGGLTVGFLSNHVSMFVRALETVVDTTIVANPKILALNKQHGEVFIGSSEGYLTTTTTTTTTQQTVNFLDTGTKLIFRPFIGDDGYIRMEVHPEVSTGTVTAGLPAKDTAEITSNIMIKDGRTVVIGGLFREEVTSSRGQVPIIGNIPILGVPFRQTGDATTRIETIVLLTPHVINDDNSMYVESEKQRQDISKALLGARAGLQPWGRDRIAQLWYGKAQEAAEKGDRDKALMFTDWTLNTTPRFIEAVKLREKLTGEKVQEASESAIDSFAQDVLKGEKVMPDSGGSGFYPPTPPTPPVPATRP